MLDFEGTIALVIQLLGGMVQLKMGAFEIDQVPFFESWSLPSMVVMILLHDLGRFS